MSDPITRLNAALEGRYRIESELGEGGMATVYLADDLKHERKVALKVLKPELAAVVGAERFLTEIKTTANLQHPHILGLHDSGEADGMLFYVMPYVDGESLRERLDREHQLPVDDAVRIATNVAEALDYAHRQGVIHRDIKPANILLQDGKPVISDFGIALAVSAGGGGRLTETGLSLGTPHYMSPEQATGDRNMGAAADIYALGCVLYEMLVGEPPFTGTTPQAILGRIVLGDAPSAAAQRPSVPPNVDAAIRRALEKLPADRFVTPLDLNRALHSTFTSPGNDARHRKLRARLGSRSMPWAIAVAAAGVALWLWLRPVSSPDSAGVIRHYTPSPWAGSSSFYSRLAISPDGGQVAYVAGDGDGEQLVEPVEPRLWTRQLDRVEATPLPGTEMAWNPFFSPDGSQIGYLHSTKNALFVVPVTGGTATEVADGVGRHGAAWGRDGHIYTSVNDGTVGLARVSLREGGLEPVTALDTSRGEQGHLWPEILPNGKGLLFTVQRDGLGEASIAALDLESGIHTELVAGVGSKYASSGHLLYVTYDGSLMAVPFDEDRLSIVGEPRAIADDVSVGYRAFDLAVSETGTLVYSTSRFERGTSSEVVWVTREGVEEEIDPGWTGDFGGPALSPDGAQLAISMGETDGTHIWIKQLDRGPETQLSSFDGTRNYRPRWSADGRWVGFISIRDTDRRAYRSEVGKQIPPELLLPNEPIVNEIGFALNDEWLVYRTGSGSTGRGRDLYAIPTGSRGSPVAVAATDSEESTAAVSRDGRWIAYQSDRSGRWEVYVHSFPDPGTMRWQVSPRGGTEPLWANSGRELFYRNASNELVSVSITVDDGFASAGEEVLFSMDGYRPGDTSRTYDVSPDDRRFVMIRMRGREVAELIWVHGLFEELKRVVPN